MVDLYNLSSGKSEVTSMTKEQADKIEEESRARAEERKNTMHTKLVGVTMGEDEGEERQKNISECTPEQPLYPLFEDDNPFDACAIKIFSDKELTKPLGYLRRDLALNLRGQMQKGWEFSFIAKAITGGETDDRAFGCNVKILAKRVRIVE